MKIGPISPPSILKQLLAIIESRREFNLVYSEFLLSDINIENKKLEYLNNCPTIIKKAYQDTVDKEVFFKNIGKLYKEDYDFYNGLRIILNNSVIDENLYLTIYMIITIKYKFLYPEDVLSNANEDYDEIDAFKEIKDIIADQLSKKSTSAEFILQLIDTLSFSRKSNELLINKTQSLKLPVDNRIYLFSKKWEEIKQKPTIKTLLFKSQLSSIDNTILKSYKKIRDDLNQIKKISSELNMLAKSLPPFSTKIEPNTGMLAKMIIESILKIFNHKNIMQVKKLQDTIEALTLTLPAFEKSLFEYQKHTTKTQSNKKNPNKKNKKRKKNKRSQITASKHAIVKENPIDDKILGMDVNAPDLMLELSAELIAPKITEKVNFIDKKDKDLKEKTMLLAYKLNESHLSSDHNEDSRNTKNAKIKKKLEIFFDDNYKIKLTKAISLIEQLGGTVTKNGSGSSHYRININGQIGDFCHKHKSGHSDTRLSCLAKKLIFSTLQRADIFKRYHANVSFDKLAPSTNRKHAFNKF